MKWLTPIACGVTIGVVAGTLQLIDTAIEPLAEDTPGAMIAILSALLVSWTLTSYTATRSTHGFKDAVLAGLLAGVATMVVVQLSSIVRVNLFLDEIQYRDDWMNLVARFQASGFQSLRAYSNYEYLTGTPLILMLGAGAGTLCGILSGGISRFLRAS